MVWVGLDRTFVVYFLFVGRVVVKCVFVDLVVIGFFVVDTSSRNNY